MPSLSDLFEGVLDLLFAPTCVACRQPIPTRSAERAVCAACWSRSRALPLPRCERCWTPLRISVRDIPPCCAMCEELRPAIRSIRSMYILAEPVRSVVHALKYGGWFSLARPMAQRMAAVELPDEVREDVGLVTAVPTSRMKERQRGYNQAALLGAETAALLRRDADCNLLERVRSSGSQTTLHPGERRANVAGAFRLSAGRRPRVAGVHVLLVDDVWTTGATALSCADTLLAAGARAVSVLTFARALPDLERHEQRLEAAATSRRRKN